jgi:hypothetical protein
MKIPPGTGWKLVFTTTALYQAEMLKSLLEEEDITAVIVNQKDSSYLTFGDIEVYVNEENLEEARIIVERFTAK